MQVMRKEWIDEGKPGYIRERLKKKDEEKETDDLYAGDIPATKEATHTVQVDKEDDSLFVPDSRGNNKPETNEDALPEDDELEALLAEQDSIVTAPRQSSSKPAQDLDSEGEDDLDALLAEHETRKAPATAAAHNPVVKSQRSSFDEEEDVDDLDDLDALLAEHDVRSKADTAQPATDKAPHPSAQDYEDNDLIQDDDDLGDLDDLDALLAEHESIHPASRPQPSGETLAPPAPSTHDDPAPDTEEVQVAAEQHDDTVDDAFQADIHEQPRAETHDELGEGAEDLEAGDMFSSSPVQGD